MLQLWITAGECEPEMAAVCDGLFEGWGGFNDDTECGLMHPILIAVALILVGCGQGAPATNQDAMQAWVGKNMADMAVQTLDGEVQALRDVGGGKPVVLNVWATWCPPCLKEMPTLDALGKQGRFTVVAIATDQDTKTVKAFLKKQAWGAGMTVWFDALGAVTRERLGAKGIPVTYVLDPSLTVVMVEAGERDWGHARMVAKMERVLKEPGTKGTKEPGSW